MVIMVKYHLLGHERMCLPLHKVVDTPFHVRNNNTVYLVIFACLNLREFLILGLFTKFRIQEFSFFSFLALL